MVIDLSCGLEVRVNDGRTDKFHAQLFEICTDTVAERCFRWQRGVVLYMIVDDLPIGVCSNEPLSRTILVLYFEEDLCIFYRCLNLGAIADDARILEEFIDFC